jgi:tetratricopeptide (TPR) repeat protein
LNKKITDRSSFWLIASLVITAIVLFNTVNNGWVNWDDHAYVLDNPRVKSLSAESISNMFTIDKPEVGNYHPFTMLSLGMNYASSGTDATGYHITNLLLHLLNVLLVFQLVRLLSGNLIIAFITATLFGIHPMHLESVAWISERKDVLYTFFFLAGLISYIRFIRQKGKMRSVYYVVCLLLLLFSLLSKAQAMTFPVILLLVDYLLQRNNWKKLLLEKVPFFILCFVFALIAMQQQQADHGMTDTLEIPFIESFFVGCYGTVMYLLKTIFPFQLSAYHPYPTLPDEGILWYFYASIIPVLGLCWLLLKVVKSNRTLFFGIVFFLVSIAPVAQVLPMGSAVIADRYTYIAYIGLFFILGHAFVYLHTNYEKYRNAVISSFAGFVIILSGITIVRTQVWENGKTLWTDVIEKYPDDFFAYGKRGEYYLTQKQFEPALEDYNKSIELNPRYASAYINRGRAHQQLGNFEDALFDFGEALRFGYKDPRVYLNRGVALLMLDNNSQALVSFTRYIKAVPKDATGYMNRGVVHRRLQNYDAAIADYTTAIRIKPNNAGLYFNRGNAYSSARNMELAIADYSHCITIDSNYGKAYLERSIILNRLQQNTEALQDALKAQQLGVDVEPEYIEFLKTHQ